MKTSLPDNRAHTPIDMYKEFVKEHPGTDIPYTYFKYVISQYNKKCADHILEGGVINLGNRLGKLRIRRITRNHEKRKIDWGETNKLKKEGVKKWVFYTDDHWYSWYWEKRICNIPNKSVYKFRPSGGDNGNRKRLSRLLKQDELAPLRFVQ